jgi:hypothetical protein
VTLSNTIKVCGLREKENKIFVVVYCGTKLTFELVFFFPPAVAADGNEPVHIKPYRSLKLWSFHLDLEESLGTLESTRAVYERIWDIGICTPQIILNLASLLEVWAMHQ